MRDASRLTVPATRVSKTTPICESSDCIVRTSFSRGTLVSVSGSGVSNAAHRIGSAAFLAPDARTSPESAYPPSIVSLSMRAVSPLLRSERLHRQCVNLLAHAVAERRIDELMLLNARESGEG